jgi:hypothetical protein
MQVNISKVPGLLPFEPAGGFSVGYGGSGLTLGGQLGVDVCPAALCGVYAGLEINFTDPWKSNLNMSGKVGPYTYQYKMAPDPNLRYFPATLEQEITNVLLQQRGF